MILRNYQIDAVDDITTSAVNGSRRIILQSACGSGKTCIGAKIISNAAGNGFNVLFLCHRREIVLQSSQKLDTFGVKHGIIMSGDPWDPSQLVNVASIQTLHSWCVRRKRANAPKADLVIIDECHHLSSSKTWQEIIDLYPEALILGLTATPINRRGKGMAHFFDAMIKCPSIQKLIDAGYLVPPKYFVPSIPDLKGLKVIAGDYSEKALEERMDRPKLIGDICENWARLGENRQTMIFATGIKHSINLAEAFNALGVKAAHIDGNTPTEERDRIVKQFTNQEIKILSNCFDSETEILTRRGWTRGDALVDSDITAAVNPENGNLVWQNIDAIVRRARGESERMVVVKNQTLDLRVTEGHRMLWRTRGAKKWRISEARDLPDRKSPYELRVAAHGYFPGISLASHDIEFLGLFSTDGSLNRKRASIVIAQSEKSFVCREIERILTSCKFDWKMSVSERRTPAGELRRYRIYRIPKGNISGKLKRSGWHRLESWLDKSLSPKLSNCSVEQFKFLLNGLWLGDGMKHERRTRKNPATTICSADRVQLDRIQEWAVVRGMACSQTWRANTSCGKYPDSTLGFVRIRNRDIVGTNNIHVKTSGGNPSGFDRGWCDESVWCVSNKTGTVIARRNGRVMVVGQCAVFTEGTDIPAAACLIFARPTKSLLLYLQVAGRVLRPFPGKQNCLILDHAGVVYEHGPIEQDWDWRLEYGDETAASKTQEKKLHREITCKQCSCVYYGKVMCPNCGWKPTVKGKEVTTFQAFLEALDEIENPKPLDKMTFYLMLRGHALQNGKNPGMAYYKFQERFGEKPKWSWNSMKTLEPNTEVIAWLDKQRRTFFWRQKNKELSKRLGYAS